MTYLLQSERKVGKDQFFKTSLLLCQENLWAWPHLNSFSLIPLLEDTPIWEARRSWLIYTQHQGEHAWSHMWGFKHIIFRLFKNAGPHEYNVPNDLTQMCKEKTEVIKYKLQQRWGTNVTSERTARAQGVTKLSSGHVYALGMICLWLKILAQLPFRVLWIGHGRLQKKSCRDVRERR